MEKTARVTKREINRYNEHLEAEFPTKELVVYSLAAGAVCALAGFISYVALGFFVL